MDTKLLQWARMLQSLAQTGIHFSESHYDVDRYRQIQNIAAEMLAAHGDLDKATIHDLITQDTGPGTPKLDVRGVVFKDDALLLVREVSDNNRWTLPGGWADVNDSPSESTVREIYEETGYRTRAVRLLALWDKSRHNRPPGFIYIYKAFILCEITGGEATTSKETSEVRFFERDALPDDDELSTPRTTRRQLERMFDHHHDPTLPADFD